MRAVPAASRPRHRRARGRRGAAPLSAHRRQERRHRLAGRGFHPGAAAVRCGMSEVSRLIKAPPEAVYRACTDVAAIVQWRVPDTMTARVDSVDGATYRML